MEDYFEANRQYFNVLTPIHEVSDFYDIRGFKAGKTTLTSIEIEELGDVSGRSLLHLQCHFGLDTMSWERLGAHVTGVDFSDRAIDLARSISLETGIPANFLCSNVYDLPDRLDEKYDVVFTSQGVLGWLPDLNRWAEVVSHSLKPGGTFYMLEIHPFAMVFDAPAGSTELKAQTRYFHPPPPARFLTEGTYADSDVRIAPQPIYEWTHSMGAILNALICAGLRIEYLHEFPYCFYRHFPAMERGEDGWWRLKAGDGLIPLMFSVKATKSVGCS